MADPGLASKYVELQIEDAERERTERREVNHLSPVEAERREALRLSIARTREQLKQAWHPQHKRFLRRTLKALEAEQ